MIVRGIKTHFFDQDSTDNVGDEGFELRESAVAVALCRRTPKYCAAIHLECRLSSHESEGGERLAGE